MNIRQVNPLLDNVQQMLIELHKECFPADELPSFKNGYWWIAFDRCRPVAFCGLNTVKSWDKAGYLVRGGVVSTHRGKGLQKKLIRIRAVKAKKVGFDFLISATRDNIPSANNLIACGFKLYQPATPWMADGSLYWIRKL